ncbi:ankyrin repeat-containing domain protein [Xylaria cubensis]|nr:ankyrin repeat-containing domain protein [Xylaria cubensis]
MEAIGLGANVVAFVVLAAQLSKKLYITLSAIKDGPNNVRRVSNHLRQLHEVLEQIRHSPLACHDTELTSHVELCVSDLESLFSSVQRLQPTEDESKTDRMWKRFKSFLDESKLDCIREQIVTHVSTLNFRLSILHSNATCELLSSTLTVNQSINDLSCGIEEQTEIIATKFADFGSIFHTRDQKLQSGLVSLQNTIDDMSSISHKRTDAILDLLAEIKTTITNPNQGVFQPGIFNDDAFGQVNYTSGGVNVNDHAGPDPGLIRSIKRLCGFVKEKSTTFDRDAEEDTQAEDITEDLWILIDSVQRHGNVATSLTHEVSSTGTYSSLDQKTLRSNLMRFRQSFGHCKILVNQETSEPNGTPSPAVRQERKYTRFLLGDLGTVSLVVTKCMRASTTEEGNSTEINYTCRTTVLSFIPQDPRQFAMIVASATQKRTAKESITPISRLAVNRVLPLGSRVFTVVRNGRLQELQAMLREGKATLRDHDEYGASLLFYAAYSRQVEMCKFLLENGADVDHVSSAHGLGGWLYNDTRPRFVLELDMMFGERGQRTLESHKADSCRRLIMEAGADPSATTLTSHKVTPSFLEWAATSGHPETMHLIWGAGLYVDINESLPTGIPPLLYCCTSFAGDRAVEGLCKLLDAGADINVRDDQGQSCLHRCLRHFWAPLESTWIRKHFDVMRLLVTRGADVYARDDRGQSVCEVAYSQKDLQYGRRGSYVGDLWDAVLCSCGYDVAEFRRDNQRRANYTDSYTRQDFETIWKGKEDQCPYWNDGPWPPDASCSFMRLNGNGDESVQIIDVSGRDRLGTPTTSTFMDNMGDDRAPWVDLSGQDQSDMTVAEMVDFPHVECTSLDSSEIDHLCTIQEDENERQNTIWNQGYRSVSNVEFPGLFENPWL